MTDRKQDLQTVQRWMQSVIVHPSGVAAGIESAAAQDAIPLPVERIEELVGRSGSQTSLQRLAVYSNAYQARLLEVLIGEYPALVHALGEDALIGLASGYLAEHPPASYTLADLGRSFPDYLERSRPAKEAEEEAPDWADFLIDLARLERIYAEVFDGPGIEGQGTLQPDALRDLTPPQWLAAGLVAAPCLRLASFRFPVHEYASAVRHRQAAEAPPACPTWLAITRRDYVVRRAALEEAEFAVLNELLRGATVGQALERALQTVSDPVDELIPRVRSWFRNWSAAGYFVRLQPDRIHRNGRTSA